MFDIEKIRNDFPMIKNNKDIIYFDNSATSFKPLSVIEEINNFYMYENTNIHRGDYKLSYNVSQKYDNVRKIVKDFINAKTEKEIVFTSGATQSLNLIAYSYGLNHINKGDTILTSYVEHASSILPWFDICKKKDANIKYIPLNDDGTFNLEKYEKCFKEENIKIVAIAHVSNVLGYINPIKEIVQIAHKHNAIVSIDGAQSAPHIKIDVQDIDCDFFSFSSHKMLGPDGVGILYGKLDLLDNMDPFIYGGGSNARFNKDRELILKNTPEKFESGTQNIEGVLGFGKAIEYLNTIGMENIHERDIELKKYFVSKLEKLENIIIYNKNVDSGIVSFNVKDIFSQDTASYLNMYGICVRSGNHCAKLLHNIIGTDDTVRASLYFYNTKEEIDRFIDVIKDISIEKCIGVII